MSKTPYHALVEALVGEPAQAIDALTSIIPGALRDALFWSELRRENPPEIAVDGGGAHSALLFAVPVLAKTPDVPRRDVLIYILRVEQENLPLALCGMHLLVRVGRLFADRVRRDGPAHAPFVVSVVLSPTAPPWVGDLACDKLRDVAPTLLDAVVPVLPRLSDELEHTTPTARRPPDMCVVICLLGAMSKLLLEPRLTTDEVRACFLPAFELMLPDGYEEALDADAVFEAIIQRTADGAPRRVASRSAAFASVGGYDELRAEGEAIGTAFGIARGEAIGVARGKAEGRRATLAKQLQLKFGALSDDDRARLDAADEAALDLWTERVLFATTLEQLFAA